MFNKKGSGICSVHIRLQPINDENTPSKPTTQPCSPKQKPELPHYVITVARREKAEILDYDIYRNRCKVIVKTHSGNIEEWGFWCSNKGHWRRVPNRFGHKGLGEMTKLRVYERKHNKRLSKYITD